MNLPLFFFGSRRIQTDARHRTALLNLCLRHEISYVDFHCATDGSISFRASAVAARRLKHLCREAGLPLQILAGEGLPFFLWRYRARAGLLLGGLFAVALMILSGCFVWDIRITGNERMTDAEIRAELRACGLYPGSYIPNLHAGELENRVLIASEGLSWVSIYLDGTVATVQVIEHIPTPEAPPTAPANLIAAMDGQIEILEIYRGNCVVKHGQAVRRGELLVSGLYDSNVLGFRYTRAAGRVYARTEQTFTVEIPLVYEEKVFEETKYGQITLKFFDFSLNIFKNSGNEDTTCDIIREEKSLDGIGLYGIPVGITVLHELPYSYRRTERTPEVALECAYAELDRRLASLSEEAQLLGKTIKTTFTDTSVILECTVQCLANIAVQSEFEITP